MFHSISIIRHQRFFDFFFKGMDRNSKGFKKKVKTSRKMTRQKEQEDQAEKQDIENVNQMTTLRFQTGEGHQTSLASLWGVHNNVNQMTTLRFQTGEGHQTSLASVWAVHNGVTVGQALQNLHKS